MDEQDKKNKWLMIALVPVFLVIFFLLIIVLFRFDKNDNTPLENVNYPEIDDELLNKLQSMVPEYNYYYSNYNNIPTSTILKNIYEYIRDYDEKKLQKIDIDELSKKVELVNPENIKPLYKIDIDTYNSWAKYLYGEKTMLKHSDFTINNITGKYVKDDGYYFYQEGDELEEKFVRETKYTKYEITDGGATLLIYDEFIKCNVADGTCYNDANNHEKNNTIKYIDGTIRYNGNNKKSYIHTFKFENDHYYWFSTEQEKRR